MRWILTGFKLLEHTVIEDTANVHAYEYKWDFTHGGTARQITVQVFNMPLTVEAALLDRSTNILM